MGNAISWEKQACFCWIPRIGAPFISVVINHFENSKSTACNVVDNSINLFHAFLLLVTYNLNLYPTVSWNTEFLSSKRFHILVMPS